MTLFFISQPLATARSSKLETNFTASCRTVSSTQIEQSMDMSLFKWSMKMTIQRIWQIFWKTSEKIKLTESTYVNTAAYRDKEPKFFHSLSQIRSFSRMWARTVVWAQSLTLRLVSSVWHELEAAVSINTQVFITGLQSQLLDIVALLTSLWLLALSQAESFPFQFHSMTISWFNLVYAGRDSNPLSFQLLLRIAHVERRVYRRPSKIYV